MPELKQMKFVPIKPGAVPVSEEEQKELNTQVPEWTISERDYVKRLERVFKFEDFATALEFTNKIGAIAEKEGHHPVLLTEWGRVGVAWWTHSVSGLHLSDFIMAAKTDTVYARFEKP